MIVYIDGEVCEEWLEFVSIGSSKNSPCGNIPDELFQEYEKIMSEYFAAQKKWQDKVMEIRKLIYQNQIDIENHQELVEAFAKEDPGRKHKEKLLAQFGWIQKGVSTWEKNGTKYILREAYNICREEFLKESK
jgi:GTPase involved in cell partitioning and DNA repair